MSHSSSKSKRAPHGMGSIRKVQRTVKGKTYTYYEARYSVGYDPGTGKQIQRSITAKTQKEVAQKLKEVTVSIDHGTYIAPSKMTVGDWLDIWAREYLGGVKSATVASYNTIIHTHLQPNLGAIKLDALVPHTIQAFYNTLTQPKVDRAALSAKTVKNVHGVLHRALEQAVANGYIRTNPTDVCTLPRIQQKDIKPLDDEQISAFLRAVKGHKFEHLYITTLFTGLREGEALGLMWDCVDLNKGTIQINKQLQLSRTKRGYVLVPTKNDKGRCITLAPYIVDTLKQVRIEQLENKLRYGAAWVNSGFVFTDPLGDHLKHNTVYKNFKKILSELGLPETRFHDLRHSYAVAAIRSGDDIKTVQGNLGHATASFTLDVYGHVTDKMQQESAARMEKFIASVI